VRVPPILPHDPHTYHHLRWRARAWTVALAIPVALGIADMVVRMNSTDPLTHKGGAWTFFLTGLFCVFASIVLWFQWRRSFRARPHRLHTDESDWTWRGVPEMDEEPEGHLTLTGKQQSIPSRW